MSYVAKNLMPGEELLLRPRYHWVRFTPAILVIFLGIVLAGLAEFLVPLPASGTGPEARSILLGTGAIIVVFGLLAAGWRWLADSFDEFAVTSLRVIRKTGVMERSVRQIPLEKIQDVNVHSTLGGRWLSYGDVEIQTAGSESTVVFPRILHPEVFRNVLFTSTRPRGGTDGLGASPAGSPARPAPEAAAATTGRAPVEARLKEAERLYKSGVLSEAEYQEKRQALIREL
ncbi:MAG: PH domain-containing protein [Thermoanaerobaculia bacterium]